MYFIAAKNADGKYYIEEIQNDWHQSIDCFEPIDAINGELLVYDDKGAKYHVGPNKKLKKKTLFGKIKIVQVGHWDFKLDEPFLISLNENNSDELRSLLVAYAFNKKIDLPRKDTDLEDLVAQIILETIRAKMPKPIREAHTHCINNKAEVMQSNLCGCFYCLETFTPDKVQEWVSGKRNAICPFCEMDTVLGDKSGFPITESFLRRMNQQWFQGDTINFS
jgi:hypothetical protein